ncbi:MAG: arylsulfatase family protein [Verrucomicrobiales bacterium]|nr:arylsulfatase family protein [Verrucomicrobiales bacterium]
MRFVLSTLLIVFTSGAAIAAPTVAKPNVLFIAVDDLNHWVGYTGRNPQVKTPNIDRLSKMGVSFTAASCAAPVCNPSRAALMSGLRPSTTGVYDNGQNWKKAIPEGRGLSFAFKQAGYYVAGAGKIYHGDTFYPSEWDDYMKRIGNDEEQHGPKGVTKLEAFHTPLQHDLKDQDLADWGITDYAIEQLGKKHDRPFFLACGLHKPHLPWVVPRKYYDLFPLESIQLPPHRDDDLKDVPKAGVRMAHTAEHAEIVKNDRWKSAVQSYLAAIAYTDMNVGRLLDALEKSAYRDNTIIVFFGDHGWHLGEKQHWRKFALWEEAVRAPFIWRVPGLTKSGTLCDRPVDFMSMYPTLCELAGIPIPKHVEGKSIKSLLADPKAEWATPGLCTYGYQNHTVRTEQWRYIRYANGDEELYDHTKDPYEWTNLAGKAELNSVKKQLAESFPKNNVQAMKQKGGAGVSD